VGTQAWGLAPHLFTGTARPQGWSRDRQQRRRPAVVAILLLHACGQSRGCLALQTLKELPYNKWRQYNPEDTIRFYSLRLREAGMIKSSPNKIIADGVDLRFFNELKRELKS
jgi:NitT/TauT family transport system substrate-binding protein